MHRMRKRQGTGKSELQLETCSCGQAVQILAFLNRHYAAGFPEKPGLLRGGFATNICFKHLQQAQIFSGRDHEHTLIDWLLRVCRVARFQRDRWASWK